MSYNLLTPGRGNHKIAKNDKSGKYLSYILHLAPSDLSGFNTCPMASMGCKQACLNTAGKGAYSNVQNARVRKTRLYFENRPEFYKQLREDLNRVIRQAEKQSKKPIVRLNGTSDLNFLDIIREYPTIQFYDYTKVLCRLKLDIPINYHLTFSRSENNQTECIKALKLGFNVAMVFDYKHGLPDTYDGFNVVSGETNDLRFLDQKNSIVGLVSKGKARKDKTGFVIYQ
jgi:Gene product 88